MVIDKSNQFANAVALNTSGTGYFNLGDVIDLRDLRDIGRGQPELYLVILITTAVTSAGSATVQFVLASDSQAPCRTDGTSENLHVASFAVPKATLIAGYQLIIPVPLESPAYARYLNLQTNIGTAALTAGNATAEFVLQPDAWKSYSAAVFA